MTKFRHNDIVRIVDPRDATNGREFQIARIKSGLYIDRSGEDWPVAWVDRVGVLASTISPAEALQELHVREQADIKAEIADEAKRIVSGARRSAYGSPEQNFDRIARFWQAYFENTGRGDVKINAADVSPMMRLMKEARLCETPDHRDSFVDLVGYTLTGAEVNGVKGVDGVSDV